MTVHTLHHFAPTRFRRIHFQTFRTPESRDAVEAPWLLGACLLVFGYMASAIALVITG